MREVILLKYGEIVLKGANRPVFESSLLKEVRRRASQYGDFRVNFSQSTMYVRPLSDDCDIDGMYGCAKKIFGISGVCRAAVCDKSMEDILRTVREYLPERLSGISTFKAEVRRSDKRFPLKSPEIAREVGAAVLEAVPGIRVDIHDPEIEVRVEVREDFAYIHAGQERGAGGLPLRCAGRGLLLLSGGIDSPVAGLMMAKRGMEIEAVHFESFPYTSERAREKVFSLAREMCEYCARIHLHVISLTRIQEELRAKCREEYFTVLLRVFMMRLSLRCAEMYKCGALITGESLGQVASQTLSALRITDAESDIPVFRPLIGLDKREIVEAAEKYGTFETSILPYEDCCTVFTPRHPKTNPKRDEVEEELSKLDVAALINEALSSMYTETFCVFDGYR